MNHNQPKYPAGAKPKVTLISSTSLPLHTVYSIWEQSKQPSVIPLRSATQIACEVPIEEVRNLFSRVVQQGIPVGEAISFNFAIEGISISLREQAVRHRIGTSVDPMGLGADIQIQVIPDKHHSSFWSQSGRINDQSHFADNGEYRVPQTIVDYRDPAAAEQGWYAGGDLLRLYHEHMRRTQELYAHLVQRGIPMEDAREIMPLGMTHRITWTLNMQALQHIAGKRACWILQLGIWGPVIEGMITELVQKVDPVFASIVTPPCLKGQPRKQPYHEYGGGDFTPAPEWTGCCYMEENARRYTKEDKLPPCPLHVTQHATPEQNVMIDIPMAEAIGIRAHQYAKFWQRDPWTGHKIEQPVDCDPRRLPVVP